jgi:16S rRNA processing protein RimM
MADPAEASVCVGIVTGPHGVRGLVKVRPFTADPADLTAYGTPTDGAGTPRPFTVMNAIKGQILVRFDGVNDRDQAEALRGLRLYVPRAALPEPEEDEYYHADLIGLTAILPDGAVLGLVRAVYDFGAGDVLEVIGSGRSPTMVPFTKAVCPLVDVPGGRVLVDPPAGLLGDGGDAAGPGGAEGERGSAPAASPGEDGAR